MRVFHTARVADRLEIALTFDEMLQLGIIAVLADNILLDELAQVLEQHVVGVFTLDNRFALLVGTKLSAEELHDGLGRHAKRRRDVFHVENVRLDTVETRLLRGNHLRHLVAIVRVLNTRWDR